MILSICIATTSARSVIIKDVLKVLEPQLNYDVELIINDNEYDIIGKKRNDMLNECKGIYQVAIDSDDLISKDYVANILKASRTLPDCIGMSGIITTNGRNKKQWHISKDYGSWYTRNNVYYRTPNHISPIKTEIAKLVMFPEIKFGEDAVFSNNVLQYLKTEVKIKSNMYHYRYDSRKK